VALVCDPTIGLDFAASPKLKDIFPSPPIIATALLPAQITALLLFGNPVSQNKTRPELNSGLVLSFKISD